MPPPPRVAEAFRSYLVDLGIVRLASSAGPLPPIFLEPKDGAPAPGELKGNENHPTTMLSVFLAPGIPPREFEGTVLRKDALDLHYRVKQAPLAVDLEKLIRAVLLDKINWIMGGRQIISTEMFRDLTRLGSDGQTYTFVQQYIFETYTE